MLDDCYLNRRMVVVDFLHDSYLGGYDIKAVMLNPSSKTPYAEQYCTVPKDYHITVGDRGCFIKEKHGQNENILWQPMPSDEYTSEIYSIVGVFDIFKDGTVEVYGKNIDQRRMHLKGLTPNTKVGHKLLLRSLKQARDKYEFVHNITMAKLRYDIDRGKYV